MKGNEVHVTSRMQYLLHFNCTLSQPQLCHQEEEEVELRLCILLCLVLSSWFHMGRSALLSAYMQTGATGHGAGE